MSRSVDVVSIGSLCGFVHEIMTPYWLETALDYHECLTSTAIACQQKESKMTDMKAHCVCSGWILNHALDFALYIKFKNLQGPE